MKIKTQLMSLLLVLGLAAGCATLTDSDKISRMTTVAALAAYTGASIDLVDNPDHKATYEATVALLSMLLDTQDYDPIKFAEAIRQLPVKELKGDKGVIIIGAAIILWDQYAREVTHLDRATYIAPVIRGVTDGLRRALGHDNLTIERANK